MKPKATLLAVLCAAAPFAALAQDQQALYVRSLAATCANCHGTDGRSVEGSVLPTLAGQPRDYLLTQLKAFRSGQRPATIMHQLTKGYTDQQLELIAGYLAAQKK